MSAIARHVNVALFVVLMRKIDFIRADSVGIVHCKHIAFEHNRCFVCRALGNSKCSVEITRNFYGIRTRHHFVNGNFSVRHGQILIFYAVGADEIDLRAVCNRITRHTVFFACDFRIDRAVRNLLELRNYRVFACYGIEGIFRLVTRDHNAVDGELFQTVI